MNKKRAIVSWICSFALLACSALPSNAQHARPGATGRGNSTHAGSGGATPSATPINPFNPLNPYAPSTYRQASGPNILSYMNQGGLQGSYSMNNFAANQAANSAIIGMVTNSPFMNQNLMQQGYMNPMMGNSFMNPMMNPMMGNSFMNPMMGNSFMNPMMGNSFMNPMMGNSFMNPMMGNSFMNPMMGNSFMNPMMGNSFMNPMMGNSFMNPMMNSMMATNPYMNPMMGNSMVGFGSVSPFMMQPGMYGNFSMPFNNFGQPGLFGRGF